MSRILLATFLLLVWTCQGLAQNSSGTRREFLEKEIRSANGFIESDSLRQYKYQKMMESPFAFYRGTNHLYYRDIADNTIEIPELWRKQGRTVSTWTQGDFHIQNIGFLDRNGVLLFDLNDFDEACVGPFHWDTLRFLASLFLAQDDFGFACGDTDMRELTLGFMAEYRKALKSVEGNSDEKEIELVRSRLGGFVRETLEDLESSKSNKKFLKKWTNEKGNVRTFDLSRPDLARMSPEDSREMDLAWPTYLADIRDFHLQNPARFQVKDRAVRLYAGLGSLGTKRYYILVEGPTSSADDDVILEVKEQRESSAAIAMPEPIPFPSHADRAKTAFRAMRTRPDPHAGKMLGARTSYFVSRISPWKFGYEPPDFSSKGDLANFLRYTACALALAHSRSDEDFPQSPVSHNFEKNALRALAEWPDADETMRELAGKYARQVREDWGIFRELVESGTLR